VNPADLTIADAGQQLRQGLLTAAALTAAHLERVAQREPVLHAFATVTTERAHADAARADRELADGVDRGPLHGIPIGLKDLIDTAGIPTCCGSRVMDGNVPSANAEVALRLVAAGAVLLGKTQTYEFAVVGPSFDLPLPPATNPWNPAHITGGSSSGSASAVAGGLLRTAIGTDTGGSIRSPACYCGVVGLKPTYGRVSKRGVFPLSPSLDHVGPIGATVEDAALTLDAISGHDPDDPASASGDWSPAAALIGRDLEGLRLGYARAWFADDPAADPAIVTAMDDAVSVLSLCGVRIEDVAMPDYDLLEAAGAVILHAEAFAVHREMMRQRPGDYGRLAYQSILSGLLLDDEAVALARRAGAALGQAIDALLLRFDALVTINTLATALPFAAFDGKSVVWTQMRTLPFNVTGHPVLAVPIGHARGLPMGMQLVGRRFDEAGLCRIGAAFETATDHLVIRPPGLGPDNATFVHV
jgi:aspartyl-tRNA(Asn)/glutamyl-tRNA(Gln) amidotransferase subunit A